jgi:FKBP-type peptidyl-prolyl cis-trans isomerase
MKRIFSFIAVVVSCCVVSCNKHTELDFDAQLQKDIAIIDAYLASNNITATQDPSGLRYVVASVGTGLKPTLESTISVKYTARFIPSNDIFDQTKGITYIVNTLIRGWQIGIPLMTKGSKFTLYVPSGLAYGTTGTSAGVGPNANVSFDIELLDDDAQLAADIAAIDVFLLDSLHTDPDLIHNDPSGLRYVYSTQGTGSKAISTSVITATYTGRLLPTKKVFVQQTTAMQMGLSDLILGWQIGIPLIPAGSQVTLYLPSGLAYGPAGSSDGTTIPPNTNVAFDINLISTN